MNCINNLLVISALALPLMVNAQKATVGLSADGGKLNYKVSYNGKTPVPASPLGMKVDNICLGTDIASFSKNPGAVTSYTVKRKDGSSFYVDIREFDDGVALRYRIPADGPKCIYSEQTAVTFPEGTRVWYASGPFQYGWIQAYQDRDISKIDNELLAPPATFRLPDGTYAAVTEANLRNFHGAVLFGNNDNSVNFGYVENKGHVESGTITGMPGNHVHDVVRDYPWIAYPDEKTGEIVTPWRVIMLASDLDGLVNNTIIGKVADAPDPELFPKGKDTEWIKPGRSVFTWLTEGNNRLSVANHKRYVDGAAELGLQSVVVDDGWELWPQTEPEGSAHTKWEYLKDLTDYAAQRGVDIWVWRPSSVRAGNKTDIGLVDAGERRQFMKKCAETGVKGLKIDFFHTENLFTVNLMEEILKEAARNKLMVIFHGVNKPTGDNFTYPNLLAKEAVRGLECVGGENSWAPGPAWTYHNTVLPFTRWLAGPADYTPLNFRAFCPKEISFAHQLATIYTFTSPMLILAADMEDMLSTPGRQFIEEVPVTWDETRVLPESKIGEMAAIARRSGDVWYLSVLNGGKQYDGNLSTDFLPKGQYRTTIASDKDNDSRQIAVTSGKTKSGRPLKVNLIPGGGYLVKFERIK